MAREFIIAQIFDKRWAEMGLSDEMLRQLQNHILQNPGIGDIIKGTGGLVKLRWSLPNTGKSSGIRALYIDFIQQETVILVNCYGKSAKDSLTDAEKAMYKELIKAIGRELS
jgi:hypothetical protein